MASPPRLKNDSAASLTPLSFVFTKRKNDRPHSEEEIAWFVNAISCTGEVKDYQMTAWMMAVCFNGMNAAETVALTRAMVRSGDIIDWSCLGDGVRTVDKHSTGGVGDKVSLILAPLVASFGIKVPMMAGRGLGHTGGTIDKLESIPGMRTSLSIDEFKQVVQKVGVAIVSAGEEMCPADRRMYSLRDVTATVSSIPLQTSSIMSKKIAENPESLCLDVKFGKASFNKDVEESIELAMSMIQVGEGCGKKTTAFITRMDHPIGHAVGNWLEVLECVEIMRSGTGPEDLVSLCLVEAAQMMIQAGFVQSIAEGVMKAQENLSTKKAYCKFREMVAAQGGETKYLEKPQEYLAAKFSFDVLSKSHGYISDIDALEIGNISTVLGAGRKSTEDSISPTAGIWLNKKLGESIQIGEKIATVYTDCEAMVETAGERIERSFEILPQKTKVPKVITHFVTKDAVEEFDFESLFTDNDLA